MRYHAQRNCPRSILFVLILIASLAAALPAGAQIPYTMSYQGVLRNALGVLFPDGSYNITINLYPQQNGGTSVYTETQNIAVAGGVFDMVVGRVVPLDVPFDHVYWVGLAIDGGAELTPRAELTAVPYAQNARHAGSVAALDSGFVRSVNNIFGKVFVTAGAGIGISQAGNTITIQNTAPPAGFSLPYAQSAASPAALFALQQSGTGQAMSLTTANTANAFNSLEVATNGSGSALRAWRSATTGAAAAIRAETSSLDSNAAAISGLVVSNTPGSISAAVRGTNNGTGANGIGVQGTQAGSGWGVYGQTPGGIGVYGLTTNNSAASSGVRGETFSTNGI
ncbi:MAG: hypothetical protein JST22_13705, partial [Bacteroidetes bacterium]|nr:hypothetical protein [Bacteroidota bacterium]